MKRILMCNGEKVNLTRETRYFLNYFYTGGISIPSDYIFSCIYLCSTTLFLHPEVDKECIELDIARCCNISNRYVKFY